jgi:hypothetical protein
MGLQGLLQGKLYLRCLPLIPKRGAYPALSEDNVKSEAGRTFAEGVEDPEMKTQLLLRGDKKKANEALRQALELLTMFLTVRLQTVEFSLLGHNTI